MNMQHTTEIRFTYRKDEQYKLEQVLSRLGPMVYKVKTYDKGERCTTYIKLNLR